MYGLGIRIGFYLQWYSGELAARLAPSEVNGIRLTNSLFVAATFLALLIQVVLDVSNLQVAEVYIILLLTFGYYLFLVPLYAWRLLTGYNPAFDPFRFTHVRPGKVYSVLNFLLLVAVASFQLWFWIARVPQLDRQACQEYGFFFAKIRLNEKGFEVLNILYCSAFYFCSLAPLCFLGRHSKERSWWQEYRRRILGIVAPSDNAATQRYVKLSSRVVRRILKVSRSYAQYVMWPLRAQSLQQLNSQSNGTRFRTSTR